MKEKYWPEHIRADLPIGCVNPLDDIETLGDTPSQRIAYPQPPTQWSIPLAVIVLAVRRQCRFPCLNRGGEIAPRALQLSKAMLGEETGCSEGIFRGVALPEHFVDDTLRGVKLSEPRQVIDRQEPGHRSRRGWSVDPRQVWTLQAWVGDPSSQQRGQVLQAATILSGAIHTEGENEPRRELELTIARFEGYVEREVPERPGLIQRASRPMEIAQERRDSSAPAPIAQASSERFRRLEVRQSALEAAGRPARAVGDEAQVDLQLTSLLWVGQPHNRLQRILEAGQCLAAGASFPGLEAGLREIGGGAVPNGGLSVVGPDSSTVRVELRGVHRLERFGDTVMQHGTS